MAKKNDINVSVGVDTKGYAKSWDDVTKITQGASKDLEKEAAKMALAVTKKIENMNLNSQARQLQNLTARMMEAGLQGTKAFAQTAAAAGKLRANIDDAKGVIEAFRPDAPFKALSTTLGAAAQGFAGVQGAMALFGAESEDVQRTLLKVQAAMAFAEGFKALDGLQDGFTQLNLIIKANPLIAGVTLFAAVVTTIAALTDSTVELTDAQKANNLIAENSVKIAQQEYGEVEALKAILLDETLTRETRTAALQQLQTKYPDYLNNLSIEKSSLQELAAATDKVSEAILKRARVQAAMDKLTELGKQQLAVDLARAELEKDRFSGGGLDQSAWAKTIAGRETFINATEAQLKREIKVYADYVDKAGGILNSAKSPTSTVQKSSGGGSKPKVQTTTSPTIANNPFMDFKSQSDAAAQFAIDIKPSLTDAAASYSLYASQIEAASQRVADANKQISSSLEGSLENMVSSVAAAIGSGQDPMLAFLDSFANGLEALGKLLIAQGIALEAVATMDPATKVVAGIAAVAIGAAIQAQMAKNREKGFASGGLIGGNSFSGDRLLAPVNSGEVILNTGQQNQLLRMANGSGGNGNNNIIAKFTGRDLLIMYDNARKDGRR